jgi:hypothetical protein
MSLSSQIASCNFFQVFLEEGSDTDLKTPVKDNQNRVHPLLTGTGKWS